MKPPSNDADSPDTGTPTPRPTPEAAGPGAVPAGTAKPAGAGPPAKPLPGLGGSGPITGPAARPDAPKPAAAQPAPNPGVSGTGPAKADPAKPAVTPDPASRTAAAPDPAKTGPAGITEPRPGVIPAEPPKPAVSPVQAAKPGSPGAEAAKPDLSRPGTTGTPPKPEPGRDGIKTEPSRAEPSRPGPAGAPQGGARPAGAVTDGPIIDLKAKRVPDPAEAARSPSAAGMARPDAPKSEPAKPEAARPTPGAAPPETPARGAGFGTVAAAGLLGGIVGAGLLFAVERGGQRDDPKLTALDQRVSGQFSALDQRVAALAPRDAVSALDKRVASNEAALKPLPEAVKGAEAAARQALEKAGAAPAAAAGTPGEAPAQGAVPADLIARLDSLDQRVSALQEEPGRDQAGDSRLAVTQTGDGAKQVAALDERLKALEGKGGAAPAAGDLGPKLAALQGDVETRTRANAEADQALGQRLDALQQALDARVKAATEAVQSATQASRQAVDAGRTQADEAAKAVDRRLQEQGERIAALDKSLAQRAEASTVQAALRVVTADRIAAALASGAPYAEPLASLRKLETGDASRADALAPFADQGAPGAAQLAAEFRPIAERAAASRKAAQAREVAATGDIRSKLLSMADSIVQVRKVDGPAAPEAGAEPDPVAKLQAALDRGALQEAAQAFDTLPAEAQAEAKAFGAKLKARLAAAQASQALLSDAFKGLPAGPSVPASGK